MRLKKGQKEALLQWVAEGIKSDEINERASNFKPPFSVSRAQVVWYRKTRKADIKAITKAGEKHAMEEGLAIKEIRLKKLKQLAALLEKDLFGGFLWVDDVKGVGSGTAATIVDFETFNKSEVDAYRGVLEDIAREMGDRKTIPEGTTMMAPTVYFGDPQAQPKPPEEKKKKKAKPKKKKKKKK